MKADPAVITAYIHTLLPPSSEKWEIDTLSTTVQYYDDKFWAEESPKRNPRTEYDDILGVTNFLRQGLWLYLGYMWASWLSGSVRDVQARDRGFDPRLGRICSNVVLL